MDRNIVLEQLHKAVVNSNSVSLPELLINESSPDVILAGLLYCCGFVYIEMLVVENEQVFNAGYLKDYLEQVLVFNPNSHTLSGKCSTTLNDIYTIIGFIENQSNTLLLHPPEYRNKQIEAFCSNNFIDLPFFYSVLKNYS